MVIDPDEEIEIKWKLDFYLELWNVKVHKKHNKWKAGHAKEILVWYMWKHLFLKRGFLMGHSNMNRDFKVQHVPQWQLEVNSAFSKAYVQTKTPYSLQNIKCLDVISLYMHHLLTVNKLWDS